MVPSIPGPVAEPLAAAVHLARALSAAKITLSPCHSSGRLPNSPLSSHLGNSDLSEGVLNLLKYLSGGGET